MPHTGSTTAVWAAGLCSCEWGDIMASSLLTRTIPRHYTNHANAGAASRLDHDRDAAPSLLPWRNDAHAGHEVVLYARSPHGASRAAHPATTWPRDVASFGMRV